MGVFQHHHIPKKQTINGKDGVLGRNLSPVDVSHFSGVMSTLESFPADKRKHSLPYPPKKKTNQNKRKYKIIGVVRCCPAPCVTTKLLGHLAMK